MSLIIASGSNQGDCLSYLQNAKKSLQKYWKLVAESNVYESPAVDYLNQPNFFNQVLEFENPQETPLEILSIVASLEKDFGRKRNIPKGPRTLDLDIIFLGDLEMNSKELCIPHPAWKQREFVRIPLQELPFYENCPFALPFLKPSGHLKKVLSK